MSYNEFKFMKITKEHIYSQFIIFETYDIRETIIPHISIEWCIFHPIRDHYMDIWYMVFYIPPHNKREVLLYFLQKMYAKFVMRKHVNYFDMWGSRALVGGFPSIVPMLAINISIDRYLHPMSSYQCQTSLVHMI